MNKPHTLKVVEVTIEDKVRDKLNDALKTSVDDIKINNNEITFSVSGYGTDITFNMLDALAGEFKTKEINFSPYSEVRGYCETCSYTETGCNFTIKNYNLD